MREREATANSPSTKPRWVCSRRVGGGPWKAKTAQKERRAESSSNPLQPWNQWLGEKAGFLANILTENTVGGALAPSTRRAYDAAWKEWGIFCRARNREIFLKGGELEALSEEQDVLTYCAVLAGPMQRKSGTLRLRLQAIGFFHRMQTGVNIFAKMPRISLFLKGVLRGEGPPERKIPATVDHLLNAHRSLNMQDRNHQILWGVILVAWYFMLRRSEYLQEGSPKRDTQATGSRRPLMDGDLLARYEKRYTHWGGPVDEIVAHLKGSKTDWLNQGTVRSHSALATGHPHPQLCPVRALQIIHRANPKRLAPGSRVGWATWANGDNIPATAITALLRLANPHPERAASQASLHSLRAGGATALYQATGSLDLVKRMGRWRSEAVSVYLWESHQLMAGLAGQMAQGGHELHQQFNG